MTLIKSISGIRGTIGGRPGYGLTPPDIVRFSAAFGTWAMHKERRPGEKPCMVVGRDARISGDMVGSIVCSTLRSIGIDVIDAGLATTPTVEMAVTATGSMAGIIITASHNPAEWNALKLLNRNGEFISAKDGSEVLLLADQGLFDFVEARSIGRITGRDFLPYHIGKVCDMPLVDAAGIRKRDFSVVVDPVNSVGGIAVPALLHALGVQRVHLVNGNPDGRFAHNPEPLPAHLSELSAEVVRRRADLGISVDPDVDRLALVNEDGTFFGEEYTLVAVSDYILAGKQGHAVSNLSSSRALRLVAEKHGGSYSASPVGEVHVVAEMKKTGAVIGGEGNGGIIVPELHYGRDALAGIALFLSHLAASGRKMSELRADYPSFEMAKRKIDLTEDADIDRILKAISEIYRGYPQDRSDGLKIDFPEKWIHLRKSNTEPVVRIYTEATTLKEAESLAELAEREIRQLVKNC